MVLKLHGLIFAESYHLPYQNQHSSSINCGTCTRVLCCVSPRNLFPFMYEAKSLRNCTKKFAHTIGDHITFGAWIFQRKRTISCVHLPFAPPVLLMVHAVAHKFRAMNNHYNSNYNDSDIGMWNEQQINNLCSVCEVCNILCCGVW